MKEVLKYKIYIKKHNSKDWLDITNFNHFVYKERPEDEKINLATIEDVEKIYRRLHFSGVFIDRKIFSKEKKVLVTSGTTVLISADDKKLQEFGGLDVLFTYMEVNCLTVSDLAKYLSSEQFMEYLKDNA